ncbi:MAG: hypothetical protein QOD12_1253 [Verrucomicrobiota bacterium]|jgi:hypothetical protein
MESAGLKEWAIVCEAIGRGQQSVILRKGGIAEGRAGFAFRHPEFFLFPTFFHEQLRKTRLSDAEIPKEREGEIEIRFFARIVAAKEIISWEKIAALEPLHILRQSVVRERFDYDDRPSLHVALVRAFRLEPGWIFPDSPGYGGCRSWVTLPEPPAETRFEPVCTDQEYERRAKAFHDLTCSCGL